MMLVHFEKVELKSSRTGKCSVCGKKRTRTARFAQTLNPYNQNKDGTLKTRDDIVKELSKRVNTWERKPFVCASCDN